MVWETGSKSLREIGEVFGGLDYAAVAQRIRRTKSTYNPIAARRLITTMFRRAKNRHLRSLEDFFFGLICACGE